MGERKGGKNCQYQHSLSRNVLQWRITDDQTDKLTDKPTDTQKDEWTDKKNDQMNAQENK